MRAPYKTDEDFKALWDFAGTRREPEKNRLILVLTYRLGLRPIELAQMSTEHFRDGELRIRAGHTKGKGGRSLMVNDEITSALNDYMQGREGHVFLNNRGKPLDAAGISSLVRRFYREAGQVGSAYSGRRTMLTNMADEGVNILVMQTIAGHSSPLTTAHYVGVTPAMMRKALFGA